VNFVVSNVIKTKATMMPRLKMVSSSFNSFPALKNGLGPNAGFAGGATMPELLVAGNVPWNELQAARCRVLCLVSCPDRRDANGRDGYQPDEQERRNAQDVARG
jgi:hypothetical protein